MIETSPNNKILRTPLPNSRADIYVFQKELSEAGESPAEDDKDNGYEVESEDEDDNGPDNTPKTPYTMLPSNVDWREKK